MKAIFANYIDHITRVYCHCSGCQMDLEAEVPVDKNDFEVEVKCSECGDTTLVMVKANGYYRTPNISKKNAMTNETIKEIASIAWKGAANAYRLYPDNKHTFSDYWDAEKEKLVVYADTDLLEALESTCINIDTSICSGALLGSYHKAMAVIKNKKAQAK